jgi:hypothetical protein
MGMPMNTIQIRLKRIRTSVHSAGVSSTKRVMIWNMPRDAATASIRHAISIDRVVVNRSTLRNRDFMGIPQLQNQKRPPAGSLCGRQLE